MGLQDLVQEEHGMKADQGMKEHELPVYQVGVGGGDTFIPTVPDAFV